jgi:hypothetical protein
MYSEAELHSREHVMQQNGPPHSGEEARVTEQARNKIYSPKACA